ncbi:MAG: FliH/SctL family protein, partial [Myxococcota bacterium]
IAGDAAGVAALAAPARRRSGRALTRVVRAGGGRVVPAVIADARAEAVRIREEARAEGLQQGLARATETMVRAEAAARRVDGDFRRLAVGVAEKILGRELALRPDAVADICAGALDQVRGRQRVIVRVHPDDLPRVRRDHAIVTFRADAEIARGGCVVETEAGVVDARLSSQLAAIERALTEEA